MILYVSELASPSKPAYFLCLVPILTKGLNDWVIPICSDAGLDPQRKGCWGGNDKISTTTGFALKFNDHLPKKDSSLPSGQCPYSIMRLFRPFVIWPHLWSSLLPWYFHFFPPPCGPAIVKWTHTHANRSPWATLWSHCWSTHSPMWFYANFFPLIFCCCWEHVSSTVTSKYYNTYLKSWNSSVSHKCLAVITNELLYAPHSAWNSF